MGCGTGLRSLFGPHLHFISFLMASCCTVICRPVLLLHVRILARAAVVVSFNICFRTSTDQSMVLLVQAVPWHIHWDAYLVLHAPDVAIGSWLDSPYVLFSLLFVCRTRSSRLPASNRFLTRP